MSDEKKPKEKVRRPAHVQSAVITGPDDVPDFMRQVLTQDRASIIEKLIEISAKDWQYEPNNPLTKEQQQQAGAAVSVFCLWFAAMLADKPLPEFHMAHLPLTPQGKPGVTH